MQQRVTRARRPSRIELQSAPKKHGQIPRFTAVDVPPGAAAEAAGRGVGAPCTGVSLCFGDAWPAGGDAPAAGGSAFVGSATDAVTEGEGGDAVSGGVGKRGAASAALFTDASPLAEPDGATLLLSANQVTVAAPSNSAPIKATGNATLRLVCATADPPLPK
jgi:hypothetical protein